MQTLRIRWFAALLFGLISLGQAYPYSYVLAHAVEAKCGCNQSGRKCIHGCELKKRKLSRVRGCHQEPAYQWVSPNCSKQSEEKVLSFQGEPFILRPVSFLLGTSGWILAPPSFSVFDFWIPPTSSPPPKG